MTFDTARPFLTRTKVIDKLQEFVTTYDQIFVNINFRPFRFLLPTEAVFIVPLIGDRAAVPYKVALAYRRALLVEIGSCLVETYKLCPAAQAMVDDVRWINEHVADILLLRPDYSL